MGYKALVNAADLNILDWFGIPNADPLNALGNTMTPSQHNAGVIAELLHNYSLEMTAKDAGALSDARSQIPEGTPISVTFLPGEGLDARIAAARTLKQLGFVPAPHISARRLRSEAELDQFLGRLSDEVGIDRAFIVAGDLAEAAGPFDDALAVIRTGKLPGYGIKRIGIGGYPEGHPEISDAKLWAALAAKHTEIFAQGCDCLIATQFAFDAGPMVSWLEKVRDIGIDAPVRLGVPGPASVKTLLRFASRCGVGASSKVMSKYGLSLTRLLNTAGPEQLIDELAARLDHERHGDYMIHFYPFGGFKQTAAWVHRFAQPEFA